MSADAKITFVWGDGPQTFQLLIGPLRELQDKSGVGPNKLYERLLDGTWLVDDASEVLRLGLIGGGMSPPEAYKLVARYCFPARPLAESLSPAIAVLAAAIVGVPDDPLPKAKASGKRAAAKGKKRTGSPSPRSTAPAAP